MNPSTDAALISDTPRKKPRLAYAIATVLGVGYIPKAPGTFGSLVGVLVGVLSAAVWVVLALVLTIVGLGVDIPTIAGHSAPWLLFLPSVLVVGAIGIAGVWSASRVANHAGLEDPQFVVIDEISGQHLTLLLGLAPRLHLDSDVFLLTSRVLNWKCLLLGFILFRVFDIWKPFPVRQLEKLPGGWGIMADDWMAGVYAAICLRLALQFGLV
jgi:phosphatidylglycerophosphatase A